MDHVSKNVEKWNILEILNIMLICIVCIVNDSF